MRFLAAIFLLSSLLPASIGTVIAQEQDTASAETAGSWADVSRNAGELLESLGAYGADRRDEAVAATGEALGDLDTEIDRLAADISRNYDSMDAATREKTREAMKTLRQQRNELAEWYGGMKHSSGNAWSEMKAGFSEAYRAMEDAWNAASEELADDDK